MPFYRVENCLIGHFGRGDIIVSPARNAEKNYHDEICFIQDDRENAVGSFVDSERWNSEFRGVNSNELNAPLRLAFDTVESLDVLAETLAELRAMMVAGE